MFLFTWAVLGLMQPAWPQEQPVEETLCILDFNRLGDDASMDWLKHGLADMMISTMSRIGPYRIIERGHLREILREHGLSKSGLFDEEAAFNQGRLAKAQFLLLGHFAIQQGNVIVAVRLIRISNTELISSAKWEGKPDKVLAAPKDLSERLLENIGRPIRTEQSAGLERVIPGTINVAESFYRGMKAFDDGQYPEALAFYLDAARVASDFSRLYLEVIQMYVLMGQAQHAVLFAGQIAERLERHDLPLSLRFYHLAADNASRLLKNGALAIHLWEKMVELAEQHENETHEAAQLKSILREKVTELYRSAKYEAVSYALGHPDIKYRIWSRSSIDEQAQEMDALGRYRVVLRDGKWNREPIPEPSPFMWKTRAQLYLARAYMREGKAKKSLAVYGQILQDHDFINTLPLPHNNEKLFWGNNLNVERMFMRLWHHGRSGELIRDRQTMIVFAPDHLVFERDFLDFKPHAKAQWWSRKKDGGHEYFYLAAPPGYEIKQVRFGVKVNGLAELDVRVPRPKGWPPEYDLSKRIEKITMHSGFHNKKVDLPQSTEIFMISIGWGYRWAESPWQLLRWQLSSLSGEREIDSLRVELKISPKASARTESSEEDFVEADQTLIQKFALLHGWDSGLVLRQQYAQAYIGEPRLDVYAMDWLVLSVGGDIQVISKDRPNTIITLPMTINTQAIEDRASLVRTLEGGYALFWRRSAGVQGSETGYFYSKSEDLINWETPQQLIFSEPQVTFPNVRDPERMKDTLNIIPIPGKYMILLEGGLVRYSDDLRHWASPKKLFTFDGSDYALLKASDGRIWAIGTHYFEEEIKPGTIVDPLAGYTQDAQGRRYYFKDAFRVSTSVDGILFSPEKTIHSDRAISSLWVFPLDQGRIGLVISFNNYFLKWLVSRTPERFSVLDSPVVLGDSRSEDVHFFVKDRRIFSIRAVHDFVEEQWVVLAASSRKAYRAIMQ